jgi:hypothetical protein
MGGGKGASPVDSDASIAELRQLMCECAPGSLLVGEYEPSSVHLSLGVADLTWLVRLPLNLVNVTFESPRGRVQEYVTSDLLEAAVLDRDDRPARIVEDKNICYPRILCRILTLDPNIAFTWNRG